MTGPRNPWTQKGVKSNHSGEDKKFNPQREYEHSATIYSIQERVASWHGYLSELAKSGALLRAIENAFDISDIDQNQLQATIRDIAQASYENLPEVSVLTPEYLQGNWSAYGLQTNTIYVDPDLASFPTLANYALTHEFGHWLEETLMNVGSNSRAIDHFVNSLVTDAGRQALGAQNESHDSSHSASGKPDTIILPSGEEEQVRWFDTSIHNTWDDELFPFLSSRAKALLRDGQNDTDALLGKLSNQFVSASHFDNNNITGGLAAARDRYKDAIASFDSSIIPEKSGKDVRDTLLNPAYSGEDAGVQLLLYRFGQIAHGLQDFYSHSNWVELAAKNVLPSSSLLDDGLGLPRVLEPGSQIPGTRVVVAMNEVDWSQYLQKTGTGSYSGKKHDVYWNVNSEGGTGNTGTWNGGLVSANPKDQAIPVYGLVTGATNGAVYHDPDHSVFLRDPSKTGFFEQEYYRGFSHGGVAVGPIYGQWVGPLNKDSKDHPRHQLAKKFATAQIQNEWDRLGNLIYASYGVAGLEKFADYALSPESRDQYVQTFSTPGSRYFPRVPQLDLRPPSPEFLLAEQEKPSISQDFGDTSQAASFADDGSESFRFIRVYRNEDLNSAVDPSQPVYEYAIQYFDPEVGRWLDSNHDQLSIHHDLHDEDLALLRTPKPLQHIANGQRAVWTLNRPQPSSPLGTNHFVEDVNLITSVGIPNFDIYHDRLVFVNPETGGEVLLDEDYYLPVNTKRLKDFLLKEHNVVINFNPVADGSAGPIVLAEKQLLQADGTENGLALDAASFFGDPDSDEETSLSFVGYDDSLPYLRLVDGKLVFTSDVNQLRGTSARIQVSVSDGISFLDNQVLEIGFAPALSLGGERSYRSSARFDLDFDKQSRRAYHIYGKLDDADESTMDSFFLVGTMAGSSNGIADSFDTDSLGVAIADSWRSGKVTFYIASPDGSDFRPLKTKVEDGEYVLYEGNQRVASLKRGVNRTQQPQAEYFFSPDSAYRWLGFGLDDRNSGSPGFHNDDSPEPYKIKVAGELHREFQPKAEAGLYLADKITGAVIDPNTGRFISHQPEQSPWKSYAIWRGAADNGRSAEIQASFSVNPSVNLANTVLVPYVDTARSGDYFSASILNPAARERFTRLASNTLGVEANGRFAGADYDDFIFEIASLDVI